jgi:hypothetical protein
MKHLKLLSTLIVLALLLSGVKNGSALSQKRRNNKHHPETTQQTDKSQSQQIQLVPSPVFQAAILEALRAIVDEEVARQKQEHADYERWNTPAFWFGDVGLVIVGALYTFFAGCQLVIIRRALDADRPLLWVRKVEAGHDPPHPGLPAEFQKIIDYASCLVQNLGKRAAIVTEVVARLKFDYPPLPLPPSFRDCLPIVVLQRIISETEPTNFIVRLSTPFTNQDIAKIDPQARERFFCYGIIRYQDPTGARYETTFGFDCQWLSEDLVNFRWQFVPDHRGYNRSA